jgi:hypothetical protein
VGAQSGVGFSDAGGGKAKELEKEREKERRADLLVCMIEPWGFGCVDLFVWLTIQNMWLCWFVRFGRNEMIEQMLLVICDCLFCRSFLLVCSSSGAFVSLARARRRPVGPGDRKERPKQRGREKEIDLSWIDWCANERRNKEMYWFCSWMKVVFLTTIVVVLWVMNVCLSLTLVVLVKRYHHCDLNIHLKYVWFEEMLRVWL